MRRRNRILFGGPGTPPPPPFNPIDLANLDFWFDFSDALTQTKTGSEIDSIVSKNDNLIEAAKTGTGPQSLSANVNTKDVGEFANTPLDFTASGQFLDSDSPFTIFCVYRTDAFQDINGDSILSLISSGTSNFAFGVAPRNSPYTDFFFGSADNHWPMSAALVANNPQLLWHYVVLRYNGGGRGDLNNYSLRVDGFEADITSSSGFIPRPNENVIGSESSGDEPFYGNILHIGKTSSYISGTTLTSLENWLLNELAMPKIINVTSSTANGTYESGDTISIQVVFNKPVSIAAFPTINLDTGGDGIDVEYTSGHRSNTLTFNYLIGFNQSSLDLDYSSIDALKINTGYIVDDDNNEVSAYLMLPNPGSSKSLSGNKNLVVTLDGTAWTPDYIEGDLELWMDNDLANITKNGSDEVSNWLDKSVNAYSYSRIPSSAIVYNATGLNGLPAIVGNGTARLVMDTPTRLMTPGDKFLFIYVVRINSFSTSYPGFMGDGDTLDQVTKIGFSNDSNYSDMFFGQSTTPGGFDKIRYGFGLSAPQNILGILTYDGLNNNFNGWTGMINNLNRFPTTAGEFGSDTSPGGIFGYDSTFFFDGAIGELIIIKNYTANDLAGIKSYLTNKWGL